MNFERGKSPAETMKIGKFQEIKKGDYFYVRFRIRESLPQYYELQKKEREGIPADAHAKDDEQEYFATGGRMVRCVVNTIPHEEFKAFWLEKEKCWVVGGRWRTPRFTDDTGPR